MSLKPSPRGTPARFAKLRNCARRLTACAAGGVLATGIVLWAAARWMPLPDELLHPAHETLTLLDRAGRELAVLPSGRARAADPLPLDAMGAWLPKVTVALEDRR